MLLTCVEHGGGWVVVASHAGEAQHPPWWLNLEAKPEATVRYRGKRRPVRARVLDGEERERLYERFVEIDKAYAVYKDRTTRRIPVVLLEPIRG